MEDEIFGDETEWLRAIIQIQREQNISLRRTMKATVIVMALGMGAYLAFLAYVERKYPRPPEKNETE